MHGCRTRIKRLYSGLLLLSCLLCRPLVKAYSDVALLRYLLLCGCSTGMGLGMGLTGTYCWARARARICPWLWLWLEPW